MAATSGVVSDSEWPELCFSETARLRSHIGSPPSPDPDLTSQTGSPVARGFCQRTYRGAPFAHRSMGRETLDDETAFGETAVDDLATTSRSRRPERR